MRRGRAVRVRRIRPRRYSAVMKMAATVITPIRPANMPTRVCATEPAPGSATGAISPDPVAVNPPPDWRYPPGGRTVRAAADISACPRAGGPGAPRR